ncbi:calcium uniporter protein, mitochondrial [Aplysia californica]|uniref:Calcium uniporter protein n=1 Tax=Aplysia californica TaxID=6500 RepID=A0A0P0ISD5_APLCA|nr:calcium uniporter protein, mitochondrial [Aplysia californica]ALK02787.1 mitochondrial calcium uniporter protein [Aplysia californica]
MAASIPFRKLLVRSLFSKQVHLEISSINSFVVRNANCKLQTLHRAPAFSHQLLRPFSSQVLYKTDVTVDIRDGLPVVALPLPSRKESCEFTLKPISQTVGDFVRFIKEEDGGVDTVTFFTAEGNRIAKSTTIDVLMRSDFKLSINEEKYDVSPPVLCPVSSEDAQTMTDVKQLISKLYSTLNVENHQLERENEILQRLEDLNMQIAPLEQKSQNLFLRANNNTNRLSWLGLGMMGLQFGILARLTWWEYSWDIMEPVTYFVTYGTSMAMFAYFVLTKQEYIFPDARDRQFLIKFYKLAKKEDLDVDKYNELREAITEAEHDLRRLRDPLQMHLPIREMEKFAKKE